MGGGAWGLSTALHMHEAGYIDITVYERASEMPSRYSAAWDLNKIVRAEYEDPFYVDLALVCSVQFRHQFNLALSCKTGFLIFDSRLHTQHTNKAVVSRTQSKAGRPRSSAPTTTKPVMLSAPPAGPQKKQHTTF